VRIKDWKSSLNLLSLKIEKKMKQETIKLVREKWGHFLLNSIQKVSACLFSSICN